MGRARALAFTSLGHFANDGSVFLLPLIVDLLGNQHGATHFEQSILLFLFYFSSMVSSVFVGRRADRTGAPGVLMAVGIACLGVGLIGFFATMVYTTGTELFTLALLFDFVMGFGSAFYHPLGGSILQASFDRDNTGRALGLNGALGSVGRALYPLIYAAAVLVVTIPDSVATFGLVGVVAAVLIWVGLGTARTGKKQEGPEGQSLRRSLTKPMVILMIITFIRSAAIFGVAAYVQIFLTAQRGTGVGSLLGVLTAVYFAPAIVGQPLFGWLVDRVDHRLVMAVSAAGASASIVGFVSAGGAVSYAFLSLFGFFAYTGFPVLLSLAADYAPAGASSLGNSLVWGLGTTGGNALGPLIVYALVLNDYGKLGVTFEYMAILALVSAVGAVLIPKPKERKAIPGQR
ncbi:MAG: MFS transporter [Nitrososphaerota archaeon]|nr:MFS transporter [Nitrososphaerota archaeon]